MKQPLRPARSDLAHVGRGLLMGGADIIPGVSGGTVALILGIYVRVVTAISRFDLTLVRHVRAGRWGRAAEHVDLRFLAALGSGILLGIAGLATLMSYLLEHHLTLTLAAFFGLILASSILVARSIPQWTLLGLVLALAGAGAAYWLVGQPFLSGSHAYPYLFFCGTVAICAMILPGISGAFILLIMGEYQYVAGVIRDLVHGQFTLPSLLTLAVFGTGCAVGLLSFSKLLRWLLARYPPETMAVLCGFMVGSLRRIWPFKEAVGPGADLQHGQYGNAWPEASGEVAAALLLAAAGVALVLALDAVTRRFSARSSPEEPAQ